MSLPQKETFVIYNLYKSVNNSVTPGARRAGNDRRYTRHGQGATPGKLGVIAGAQGTNNERFLEKDLAKGHRDELTPHQKERDSEIVLV